MRVLGGMACLLFLVLGACGGEAAESEPLPAVEDRLPLAPTTAPPETTTPTTVATTAAAVTTAAPATTAAPKVTAAPATTAAPSPTTAGVSYRSCDEAKAAGAAPM